jgi:hypothetical protein
LLFVLVFNTFLWAFSQEVNLRPYYGHKWYSIGDKQIRSNNFDPTFNTNLKSDRYLFGLGLEAKKKNHSYELYVSSQPYLARFYTTTPGGIGGTDEMDGSMLQLQTLYNYYFKNTFKINKEYSFTPKISVGIGFGNYRKRNLSPIFFSDKDVFIDPYGLIPDSLTINFKANKKAPSFSSIFRIGFMFEKNKKEKFTIGAFYNIALNDFVINDYQYFHNTIEYGGHVSQKCNYYGIQISVPIKLFKF